MSDLLIVQSADEQWRLPLPRSSLTLGADGALELCIPHLEVAPQALTIDNRGKCPLVTNLNPFPIYIGSSQIDPGVCATWDRDQVVQLTRSVSLEIASDAESTAAGEPPQTRRRGPASGPTTRQASQLATIAVCGLTACLLLAGPSHSSSSEAAASFEQLWQEVVRFDSPATPRGAWRTLLLQAFQEARLADLRWQDDDPQQVVAAYHRLLQQEVVRRPIAVEEELAAQIRQYSTRRIVAMWDQMNRR